MRYKRVNYTARVMLKTRELSKATVNHVARKVRDECKAMCKNSPAKSLFKFTSIHQLKKFDINLLSSELAKRAPTLFTLLKSASTRSAKHKPCLNMVTMATAVLLKAHSQKMCTLQTLVGTILYSGHASKRVRASQRIINQIILITCCYCRFILAYRS